MSEEKKRTEAGNWNIDEVVLSPDGKSIESISGDIVLTRNKLRAFIDKEKLSGRSGARSKEAMIQLIMSHARTASVYKEMYKTEKTPTKTNVTPKGNINSKKVAKQTVPKFVTQVGTLYRYIICKMDQRTRGDAIALNSALSREQSDSRERSPFYKTIAKVYNDETISEFFSLGLNLSDKAYFDAHGIDDASLKMYDKPLTPEGAYQIDAYINFWYTKASKNHKASGNHDDFVNFCPKPFIDLVIKLFIIIPLYIH